MEKLTYKQAFDLITEAYIKNEIKALHSNFCFCGTLCGNNMGWAYGESSDPAFKLYSRQEYREMEAPLLSDDVVYDDDDNPEDEEVFFMAICESLEVLKQIHKERGENVEDFQFTKRSIQQIQNQTV